MSVSVISLPGLGDALENADIAYRQIEDADGNQSIVTSDDTAAQNIIDNYTLDDAKKWLKRQLQTEINAAYERAIVDLYGERPHDLESNSWNGKEKAAKAWDAWNLSDKSAPEPDTTVLQSRVTVANPLVDEVARVLAKAIALHGAEDAIQAHAQQIKEAIANAADFSALNAVNINTGWPV